MVSRLARQMRGTQFTGYIVSFGRTFRQLNQKGAETKTLCRLSKIRHCNAAKILCSNFSLPTLSIVNLKRSLGFAFSAKKLRAASQISISFSLFSINGIIVSPLLIELPKSPPNETM